MAAVVILFLSETKGQAHPGRGRAEGKLHLGRHGRETGRIAGFGDLPQMIVADAQKDDAGGTGGQAGEHDGGTDIYARPQVIPDFVHGFLTAGGDEYGGENASDQINAPVGEAGGSQGIATRRQTDSPTALTRIFSQEATNS